MQDIIIVGGGLSGLVTAYYLKQKNIHIKVLEAQNRIGGRIETIMGNNGTPMEMGATWFGQEHTHFIQFLKEIGIDFFEQHTEGNALFETMSFEPPQQYFVPTNTHSAFRVGGGTEKIIDYLAAYIGDENILLNTQIVSIIEEADGIKIIDSDQQCYNCKKIVIAAPPQTITDHIQFTPSLPQNLVDLMQKTQTWMSGSTKFSVEYATPFWRDHQFSGTVFSQSGLATEIYDHCSIDHTKFALKGFLNGNASHYTQQERKEKVISQFVQYFGDLASAYLSYNDKIWNHKYIQTPNSSFLPPHFNNGHALYSETYLNNKLYFTGTETSKLFSGYMEGAVIAAKQVVQKLVAFN